MSPGLMCQGHIDEVEMGGQTTGDWLNVENAGVRPDSLYVFFFFFFFFFFFETVEGRGARITGL